MLADPIINLLLPAPPLHHESGACFSIQRLDLQRLEMNNSSQAFFVARHPLAHLTNFGLLFRAIVQVVEDLLL